MAIDDTPDPELDDLTGDAPDVAHERLRKNIAARITRLITTEEGLRTVVGAVVPKELIASTLDQVDATKSEAMAMVGRELRTFLDHLDVGEELAKILTAVSFEIRLEVRFVPNEDGTLRARVRGGAKPKVKVEPRRKPWQRRTSESEDEADVEEADEPTAAPAPEPASEETPAPTPEAAPRSERMHTTSASEARPAGPSYGVDDEPERRLRDRLGRGKFTNMVERVADVAATTARVAAEVAADAAAEVVNEARRNRDDDDSLDDY